MLAPSINATFNHNTTNGKMALGISNFANNFRSYWNCGCQFQFFCSKIDFVKKLRLLSNFTSPSRQPYGEDGSVESGPQRYRDMEAEWLVQCWYQGICFYKKKRKLYQVQNKHCNPSPAYYISLKGIQRELRWNRQTTDISNAVT